MCVESSACRGGRLEGRRRDADAPRERGAAPGVVRSNGVQGPLSLVAAFGSSNAGYALAILSRKLSISGAAMSRPSRVLTKRIPETVGPWIVRPRTISCRTTSKSPLRSRGRNSRWWAIGEALTEGARIRLVNYAHIDSQRCAQIAVFTGVVESRRVASSVFLAPGQTAANVAFSHG
jgi:hypothetical protein